jgi:hypothetical protein
MHHLFQKLSQRRAVRIRESKLSVTASRYQRSEQERQDRSFYLGFFKRTRDSKISVTSSRYQRSDTFIASSSKISVTASRYQRSEAFIVLLIRKDSGELACLLLLSRLHISLLPAPSPLPVSLPPTDLSPEVKRRSVFVPKYHVARQTCAHSVAEWG